MTRYRKTVAAVGAAAVIVGCALVSGAAQQRLPMAPLGRSGNAVFPALEGWFKNADGTTTFLIGYYNRNESPVDIPIGPNNHIEPGGPDKGQPTYFLPRRQYGVFGVTVPRDFGNKRLTWTLNINGQPEAIALWINPPYIIDPYRNASNGNTPPKVRFEPRGPETVAVPKSLAKTFEASIATPLEIPLWVTDEGNTILLNPFASQQSAPGALGRSTPGRGISSTAGEAGANSANEVRVTWSKYRGTGDVKFMPSSPTVRDGQAVTHVSFSTPGEYWLRSQVNDSSGEGGGGDQCCWTNAHVKVLVK
jgi:hypothetical protein